MFLKENFNNLIKGNPKIEETRANSRRKEEDVKRLKLLKSLKLNAVNSLRESLGEISVRKSLKDLAGKPNRLLGDVEDRLWMIEDKIQTLIEKQVDRKWLPPSIVAERAEIIAKAMPAGIEFASAIFSSSQQRQTEEEFVDIFHRACLKRGLPSNSIYYLPFLYGVEMACLTAGRIPEAVRTLEIISNMDVDVYPEGLIEEDIDFFNQSRRILNPWNARSEINEADQALSKHGYFRDVDRLTYYFV